MPGEGLAPQEHPFYERYHFYIILLGFNYIFLVMILLFYLLFNLKWNANVRKNEMHGMR